MKLFLSTLPRNIKHCFKGRMIIWHLIAASLTFILVASGLDWRYSPPQPNGPETAIA